LLYPRGQAVRRYAGVRARPAGAGDDDLGVHVRQHLRRAGADLVVADVGCAREVRRALLNAYPTTTRRLEAELKSAGPKRRVRMNQLPQQAVLSRTGLVRLVDRIEAAGLMRREPVPEDGRRA
jgi:hypothetical protein